MGESKIPLFKVFMPDNVIASLQDTLNSGYIAEGKKTFEFNKKVSEFIQNPKTVLVNSGTTALQIAYRLSDVGSGDEVITTPLTSIATNVPILSLGAKPVWADVDPETGLSDLKDIEKLINNKTKAIVILHKDGDIANLDELNILADKYSVKVIEDAAHAFGAKYRNRMIGNHGDHICFSFQAIKHITTGDGGAISCKSNDDYLRAKKLKWFGVDHDEKGAGNPWLNDISEIGYKGNMNDIAASIGIEQIKHINSIIDGFHRNGNMYSELLKDITGVKVLRRDSEVFSTYWTYTFLAEDRDKLKNYLNNEGIGADQVHPRNDVWSIFSESKRSLPGVDYFSAHEISLPSGWWVKEKDVERICNLIKKFYKGRK
jgi:perosamine synthetase